VAARCINFDTGDPANLKVAGRGRAFETPDVRRCRPWLSLGSILSPCAAGELIAVINVFAVK